MKIRTNFIGMLLPLFLLLAMPLNAQGNASLALGNISHGGALPAYINVPVTVKNFNNIGAISLRITYDTLVMNCTGIRKLARGIDLSFNKRNGAIYLGWFDITGKNPKSLGSDTLVYLQFKYNGGYGNIFFDKSQCEIADGIGQIISSEYVNGSIIFNATGVNDESAPGDYGLYQNYPNPFNPSTVIRYSLAQSGHTSLRIINSCGKEITRLVNQTQSKGIHEVVFDACGLSSGIYYYRLESGQFVQTRKLVVLK